METSLVELQKGGFFLDEFQKEVIGFIQHVNPPDSNKTKPIMEQTVDEVKEQTNEEIKDLILSDDKYTPPLQSVSTEILLDVVEDLLSKHEYKEALSKIKAHAHMDLCKRTEIFAETCFLAYLSTNDKAFLTQARDEIVAWRFQQPLDKADFWCDITLQHLERSGNSLALFASYLSQTLSTDKRFNIAVAVLKAQVQFESRAIFTAEDLLSFATFCPSDLRYYAAIAMSVKSCCPSLEKSGVNLLEIYPVQADEWLYNCHLAIIKRWSK